MDLKTIRSDAEEVAQALERGRYEAESGQKALSLEAALRLHPDVPTPEAFALAREARAASTGKRADRLGALSEFLAGLVETAFAREAEEELARVERTLMVIAPGSGEVSLHAAQEKLPAMKNRDHRAALERDLAYATQKLDSAAARRLEAAQESSRRLGFATHVEACSELSGIDLEALGAECERLLTDTDAMYGDVLGWWLRRTTGLRPFPHGAERHDVLHALEASYFDGLFKRDDLLRTAQFLPALGLDPRADGRIRLEETAPARAFVTRFEVPEEIVLAHRLGGGVGTFGSFLHALGTAQQLANVETARPFEDRWLGDESLGEGYGCLFAHLLLDRGWLKRFLRAEHPDLVRVLALRGLFEARRDAVTVLHELDLHRRGPSSEVRASYADRLSHATGAKWPGEFFLHDARPRFGSARRLRGKAFEAALFEMLRERFDEDWWINPRAGVFLKGLFAQGTMEPAHVLCERLSLGPLSPARVAKRMEALLG